MKAIINQTRYDTGTAKKIAGADNGFEHGDWQRSQETLYLTPKGAWFLHGNGGPCSEYRKFAGGGYVADEVIRPLTRDEARQWCERHRQIDALEDYFSDRIEDG